MKRVHNIPPSPQAIMETAFTRVVLPMPIFVLPPIIMSYLERFVYNFFITYNYLFIFKNSIHVFFL